MIRLVGPAKYRYDLAPINSGEDWGDELIYPNGSECIDIPSNALAFWLVVDYNNESTSAPFVLLPTIAEEQTLFDLVRLRASEFDETEQPPDFSQADDAAARIVSWRDEAISRKEQRWQQLQLAKNAVIRSQCFLDAASQVLNRPVSLMPARPQGFDCILFRDRLWTTREDLSAQDWDLLVMEYDERKKSRLDRLASKYRGASTSTQFSPVFATKPNISYQTAPLVTYNESFRRTAEILYEEVRATSGQRAKRYKGSYSVVAKSCGETVAKIIIYQCGLGRENGIWSQLDDGVYVLVRASGGIAPAIWQDDILGTLGHRLDRTRTIGVAPKHDEQFAYFRLRDRDNHREIADAISRLSYC